MPGKRVASILPAMATPHAAIAAMRERVAAVETEHVELSECVGRVLAESPLAQRDSPAADVSAVDGYAMDQPGIDVALALMAKDGNATIPLAFTVTTGSLPSTLPAGQTARVFTGGVVPAGAIAVLRRELVEESPDHIVITAAAEDELRQPRHIRRHGENLTAGQKLLDSGTLVTPAAIASLAAQGVAELCVYRPLRIGIAVTGNELQDAAEAELGSAQVRDSNGPSLTALLRPTPWCGAIELQRLHDDLDATTASLEALTERCDAVLTTGGISMGDHDYIPDALVRLGAEVVYHHLAMRPGKPNLGALLRGTPVIALPGNPVSALVGTVVLAGPVLRERAGFTVAAPHHRVEPSRQDNDTPTIPLWHYRLAKQQGDRMVRLSSYRGSGDVSALGRSDGFFEVPPDETDAQAPRRWYDWRLA